MASLDQYLDQQLARGRAYFSRKDALDALGLAPDTLAVAVSRLIKKRRLANPRHGFYLILRPEGQQVIVPKQLRAFEIGRHRLQFVYQAPHAFAKANHPEWLAQMKSDAGFANVAGVELTLLDCARYFHRAAGINGVAQIVKDLGAKANSRKLAKLAAVYENSSVRRLGYLLELAGHVRQANALEPFARQAKSVKPLDPSVKSFIASLASPLQLDAGHQRNGGDRFLIPHAHLQEWSAKAPWPDLRQVEQDLVICRALCDLFNAPGLAGKISFRGGPAINKLLFRQPLRYSEDIDLVQTARADRHYSRCDPRGAGVDGEVQSESGWPLDAPLSANIRETPAFREIRAEGSGDDHGRDSQMANRLWADSRRSLTGQERKLSQDQLGGHNYPLYVLAYQ